MELLKPQRLEKGDHIGVVSTSSPVSQEVLDRTVAYWEQRGYQVVLGRHVADDLGYMAGLPEERAADLMAMFMDPRIKAIIVAMGGKSANQLLPLLDYRLIRANPKIFMGLSDPSIVALAIHAGAGIVTFHGPTGYNFGVEGLPPYTEYHMFKALTCSEPIGEVEAFSQWQVLRSGDLVEGPIVGGHLGTIRSLIGTSYAPHWNGAILFVEEIFAEHHDVDAALTHFRLACAFESIAGLIFGRSVEVAERSYPCRESLEEVILRICAGYDFPILFGVDLGHTAEKITLPIGTRVRLDTQAGTLTLLESGVV